MLGTNKEYRPSIVEPFEAYIKQIENNPQKDRNGMVIVDMFGGVGTAIVVLKHLGIKIKTVFHVERDKIATHVYRYNHDREYNKELPEDGGIQHVYFNSFEAFEKQADDIHEKYGPIDLIIGGPPSSDYSAVNARKEGTQGQQGQYMIRLGKLICRLQQLQHDRNCPLFYLVENVVLREKDLVEVREAFQIDWDPVRLDAKYVSP